MKYIRGLFALLMTILLLGLPTASEAKGIPTQVLITGGQLPGQIKLTDPAMTQHFGLGVFMQIPNAIQPQTFTNGYVIDAEGGWDSKTYYPDPNGALGYVYYKGLTNGSSEYDRKWFRATPEGEAAMRQVLSQQESSSSVAQESMPSQSELLTAVGILSIFVLSAAGFVLVRRARHNAV